MKIKYIELEKDKDIMVLNKSIYNFELIYEYNKKSNYKLTLFFVSNYNVLIKIISVNMKNIISYIFIHIILNKLDSSLFNAYKKNNI